MIFAKIPKTNGEGYYQVVNQKSYPRPPNKTYFQTMLTLALQPLNHQHYNHKPSCLIPISEETIRSHYSILAEHSVYVLPGTTNTLGTENNPAHDNKHKRQQHHKEFLRSRQKLTFGNRTCVFTIPAPKYKWQKQQRVISTPCYESPVCTVPKPAQQKNYKCVSYNLSLSGTATSKRNIDIIAEPSIERNVPPSAMSRLKYGTLKLRINFIPNNFAVPMAMSE